MGIGKRLDDGRGDEVDEREVECRGDEYCGEGDEQVEEPAHG